MTSDLQWMPLRPLMDASLPHDTAQEAGKVLDALAVISHDLSCHGRGHPDTLVLPADRVAEVCAAIDEAVASLRKILKVADPRAATLLTHGSAGTEQS